MRLCLPILAILSAIVLSGCTAEDVGRGLKRSCEDNPRYCTVHEEGGR